VKKFIGACNQARRVLDECLQRDFEERRAANLKIARAKSKAFAEKMREERE